MAKPVTNPRKIDLSSNLSGLFGKYEVEAAACELVRFCQQWSGWPTFQLEDLVVYYQQHKLDPNTMLFGLIGYWYDDSGQGVVRGAPIQAIIHWGERFSISEEFIERVSKFMIEED